MKPELYKEVALTQDIPAANLKQGDVAMCIGRNVWHKMIRPTPCVVGAANWSHL